MGREGLALNLCPMSLPAKAIIWSFNYVKDTVCPKKNKAGVWLNSSGHKKQNVTRPISYDTVILEDGPSGPTTHQ